jgi:uncharacterized protein YdaU (DUF1376 family)
MNYWERHIGDYARDAGHLTMLEHGAYTLLLDRYYSTEQPIPEDQAHRICRARTKEERAAVDAVLDEFFSLLDGHWINGRAAREVVKAQTKIEAARTNGAKGGRPKVKVEVTQEKPTGLLLGSVGETQSKALQTPDSIHQTKETPPYPRKRGQVSEFPPGFDRFWQAYPRKADKPAACKAFARARVDDALLERMLSAIAAQAMTPQWAKDGGQFVPLPATWLNGRRWEDEFTGSGVHVDVFAGAV